MHLITMLHSGMPMDVERTPEYQPDTRKPRVPGNRKHRKPVEEEDTLDTTLPIAHQEPPQVTGFIVFRIRKITLFHLSNR